MAAVILRAARRVFVATPAWEDYWRPCALGRGVEFEWRARALDRSRL